MQQEVIQIQIKKFLPWFQQNLDQKYNLDQLKSLFLSFLSLSRQLIGLYWSINERVSTPKPAFQNLEAVCRNVHLVTTNSILLIKSMSDGMPTCIDLGFCQRFTKDFQQKLNGLCCFYHSLGHLDQQFGLIFKNERDTIADGINKLYQLAGSIKELVKEYLTPLKTLSDYKKLFTSKISTILTHVSEFSQSQSFFKNFATSSIQYQKSLLSILKQAQKDDERQQLSSFMGQYFELLNHCCSTQVQLESLLQAPINICQYIKAKKKENILTGEPQWNNQLARYLNSLPQPNFVSKHLRKIKIEEFMLFLRILCSQKQILANSDQQGFEFDQAESHLRETLELMQEDLRELEKVDIAELASVISDYREKFIAPDTKRKFMDKLAEYQLWMYRYYKINEEFKSLYRIAQTIVAKEFRIRVELILTL